MLRTVARGVQAGFRKKNGDEGRDLNRLRNNTPSAFPGRLFRDSSLKFPSCPREVHRRFFSTRGEEQNRNEDWKATHGTIANDRVIAARLKTPILPEFSLSSPLNEKKKERKLRWGASLDVPRRTNTIRK